MKMSITKNATLEFDTAVERKSINKSFRGKHYVETRQKLLKLMDLIESQQWKKAAKELDGKWWSGRDEKMECPRLEFVGTIRNMSPFFSSWMSYADVVFAMAMYPDNYSSTSTGFTTKVKKNEKSTKIKKPELKPAPCPCCGNRMLYVGELDDQVFGVRCPSYQSGCGLELGVSLKINKKTLELPDLAIDTEMLKCQIEAIKRWNRRQQQVIPTSLLNDIQVFNEKMGKLVKTNKKKVKK